MNSFKRANNALTHAQIVNEYESKVRALERDNERLRENNEKLHWKIEKTRYFVNNRMTSFKNSLKKEPDKIKQAQLKLCRDIQGELR